MLTKKFKDFFYSGLILYEQEQNISGLIKALRAYTSLWSWKMNFFLGKKVPSLTFSEFLIETMNCIHFVPLSLGLNIRIQNWLGEKLKKKNQIAMMLKVIENWKVFLFFMSTRKVSSLVKCAVVPLNVEYPRHVFDAPMNTRTSEKSRNKTKTFSWDWFSYIFIHEKIQYRNH